jgi:uncharacterized membrane protein YvbJ
MKHCPKCRMETRNDADWCWHCGYSYEDAEAQAQSVASGPLAEDAAPDDPETEPSA